jgi:hypothetical protein
MVHELDLKVVLLFRLSAAFRSVNDGDHVCGTNRSSLDKLW